MKSVPKTGYPHTPWEVINSIWSSKASLLQKVVMQKIADTSIGMFNSYSRISYRELAKHIGNDNPNICRAVGGLKASGLVEKKKVDGIWVFSLAYVEEYLIEHPERIKRLYAGDKKNADERVQEQAEAESKIREEAAYLAQELAKEFRERGKEKVIERRAAEKAPTINASEAAFRNINRKMGQDIWEVGPEHLLGSCVTA